MPSRLVPPWLLLAVLTGACASSPPERPAPEAPPPPVLLKSPLALLLEHHAELGLTTDQMIEVGKHESALQEKNKMLRMKLRELRPRAWGQPPPRGASDTSPPPGVNPRGWSGGMDQRRGSSWGGMRPRPPEGPPETEEARQQREAQVQAILREMEDNTVAAYAEAEKVLDESQKARARTLIEQHREERRQAREAMEEPPPET